MEEIKIKLDFRSKKSLSDQVQDEIRRLIQDKFLQPGEQLPTVRKLAAQLRVNFNTIARAYRVLDQEGLITTHQGRGTYILEESEVSSPFPLLTKEEQVDMLVNDMLEKAGRLDISIEELYSVLKIRLEPVPIRKPKPQRRRIRIEQKRRRFIPTWYQKWTNVKNRPGHATRWRIRSKGRK